MTTPDIPSSGSAHLRSQSPWQSFIAFATLPWPTNALILLGVLFDFALFILLSPLLLIVWAAAKTVKAARRLKSA